MSFFAELKRRNVLRVGAAYIVTAWLVIQVVETIFPAFGFGDVAVRYVTIAETARQEGRSEAIIESLHRGSALGGYFLPATGTERLGDAAQPDDDRPGSIVTKGVRLN